MFFNRPPKSGSDWNCCDFIAYNIVISSIPPRDFFPDPDLSLDHVDSAIPNSRPGDNDPALSDVAVNYLSHLKLAAGSSQAWWWKACRRQH